MQTSVLLRFTHEVLRGVTEVICLKRSRHVKRINFLTFSNKGNILFFPLTFILNLSLCFANFASFSFNYSHYSSNF